MIKKVVDDEIFEHHIRSARIKYRNLLSSLSEKSRAAGTGVDSLPDIVRDTSMLFGGSLHLVEEEFRKDSGLNTIRSRDDLLILYSAYIASRVASQDAERTVGQGGTNSLVQGKKKLDKQLVERGKTEFSTVKMALEGMVEHVIGSKGSPFQSIVDYFSEYSNQVNVELSGALQKGELEKISQIQWTIGPYDVDGLHAVIAASNGNSSSNIQVREKQQFNTPLKYLKIPDDKRLAKDRIVGDQETITYLERMVRCLFLYDSNIDRNPMRDARIFQNAILLQGLHGQGKGAVSYHSIDFAEQLNDRLGGNLLVTKFDIDSSYVDGRIQKLKSQFHQISSERRIFLVYQDEIDGMLEDRKSANGQNSNQDVVQEFNKFLDGEYPNKGNYLLIGNINDVGNLRATHQSRFNIINWQGPTTEEQYFSLWKYKLEKGVREGYVSVSDGDLKQLGNLSMKYVLSGRDVTKICERAIGDSFSWDKLGEVHELRGDYQRQIQHIPSLFKRIDYSNLQGRVNNFVEHKERAHKDSQEYRR
ncbi:MAG: AAA family ATPase [archaeon]